jgi:2-polyprenyl-3-methyl-5-hydroxy-6-metoxy-1,4-benzoquinol methylase
MNVLSEPSSQPQGLGGPYERLYAAEASVWGGHVGQMVKVYCQDLAARKPHAARLRALDIGCGEGDNAIHLAKHGHTVKAIDVSPSAIVKTRDRIARLPADLSEHIELSCGSVTAVDIFGRYDVVVAYGLLHCFDNAETAANVAAACRSMVAPGGYLLLSVLTNGVGTSEEAHPELLSCHIPSTNEVLAWIQPMQKVSVEVESFEEAHGGGPLHRHEVLKGIFRTVG